MPAPNFVADPDFSWDGWSMNLAPVVGAHGDVIAIHDGRLISFDPALGSISWQVRSQFTGQPSVAKGRIYAIDGGKLVVLDELTHATLWSWQAPFGDVTGPMIVTDTHVLASTAGGVHAVDLVTRASVWSYPVVGHLALADGTLYVASSDGTLTAIVADPKPSGFYAVSPCRVVDTRGAAGVPVGGPALDALTVRTMRIAGNCGVSPAAKAVSINVTVTQSGASGSLNIYPAGTQNPLTSLTSYASGKTRANNAIAALNQAGEVDVLATQDAGTSVHVIIDVNGFFE